MPTPDLAAPGLPTPPDLSAVKLRQQGAWAAGDYAIVGTTLQIVGEQLCEAMDLRSGALVLDVAAGNGNASLAAARRWGIVTSTDYVPALLERGRARAEAEGLEIAFLTADAEALPFPAASFDAVLSTFGVMFTPDQDKAAAELLRVCRPGGRIGLANWTPDSFIGQLFRIIGQHVPPAAGLKSPALWGTADRLETLLGGGGDIRTERRRYMFRYRSSTHWLDVFRTWYGPVNRAFATLPESGQQDLRRDMLALADGLNLATDGTMVVLGDYLEVVIDRR